MTQSEKVDIGDKYVLAFQFTDRAKVAFPNKYHPGEGCLSYYSMGYGQNHMGNKCISRSGTSMSHDRGLNCSFLDLLTYFYPRSKSVDPDQTVQMFRLIWIYTVSLPIKIYARHGVKD